MDTLHLPEDFSIYQRSIKINKNIEIGSTGGIGEGEGSNNSIDMILFYFFSPVFVREL